MKKITLKICSVVVFGMLASSSYAQFAYSGGNLSGSQTYNGTGVDSGLNPYTVPGTSDDYVGGSFGSGSLTVASGSLTINDDDFKIDNNAGAGSGFTGLVTVDSGATLNINQEQYGAGVAQGAGSVGSLVINGGNVNWAINGTSESRFRIGNGPGNGPAANAAQGTVTLNGGSLNLSSTSLNNNDSGAGITVGSDGGIGILNLNAGTLLDTIALPFSVGGVYTSGTISGGLGGFQVLPYTSGTINIGNGTLEMTAAYAPFSATAASFVFGNNSGNNTATVDFTGGTGSLSLLGWTSAQYAALASAGNLEVDGSVVNNLNDFTYSLNGSQGELALAVPEPSSLVLLDAGFIVFGFMIRRRFDNQTH